MTPDPSQDRRSGPATNLPEKLFGAAVIWHVRLRQPGTTAETRAAFQEWLRRDPRHGTAYAEAESLWAATAQPAAAVLRQDAARTSANGTSSAPRWSLPVRRRAGWLAVAASLLLAVYGGVWGGNGGFDDLRSDYVTDVGEVRSVGLADGSTLVLNTDTALAVSLDGPRRIVRLFRGEAYFDVAHDTARPFVVETPAGIVRVTGTAFNLRLDRQKVMVSVLKGQVTVEPAKDGDGVSVRSAALRAGQQVDLLQNTVGRAGALDASAVTAWQRRQLVFYRTPLGDVVRELNRYRRGHIVIANDGLRELSVTGIFDAAHPDSALAVIERTLHVKALQLTDRLIILH